MVRAREAYAVGPLNNVDWIDTSTSVDDDSFHLRRSTVGNQDVNSRIDHPSQAPLLAGRREANHCGEIASANCSQNLLAIAWPLRAPEHTGQHRDEFLPLDHLGDVALSATELDKLCNGDDPEVCAEPGIH